MGIRVHKAMGYGLSDLNISKDIFKISEDPRFDPKGFFALPEKEALTQFTTEGLLKQLSESCSTYYLKSTVPTYSLVRALINEIKTNGLDFHKILVREPECECSNVCVFIPPTCRETCSRSDDPIDYYEETVDHEQISHIQILNRPLYPFVGWTDLRPNPPCQAEEDLIQLRNQICFYPSTIPTIEIEKLNEVYGFTSVDELMDNIVPMVPFELVELLQYLKVFKDPNAVFNLKPMIYTYWS